MARKTKTQIIAEISDQYNVAVQALQEKDVEISRLNKDNDGLVRRLAKAENDVAAIMRIAINAKVARHQMHNDLHATALAYVASLAPAAPVKRGVVRRFLDAVAASF